MWRDVTLKLAVICLALAPSAGSAQEPPPAFEDALAKAQELLQAEDYEKAVKAFKKAHKLESAPSFDCALGQATAFNGIGAFKNAGESAREALELAATPAEQAAAYIQQGIAQYAKGNADGEELRRAEQSLRKVLELSDGDINEARFPLGVILLKQERDEEGVAVLEKYLARTPRGRSADQARAYVENPLRARVPIVPEFDLVTLEGEYLTPQDLLGKVVLLDFWGTWCGPCVAAIPHLRRLSRKSDENPFVIVGIAADSDEGKLRSFLSEHEMAWPQFIDRRRQVSNGIFEVTSYPTYILVDHEGVMIYRRSGWSTRIGAELSRQVGKAIKAARKAND